MICDRCIESGLYMICKNADGYTMQSQKYKKKATFHDHIFVTVVVIGVTFHDHIYLNVVVKGLSRPHFRKCGRESLLEGT